MAALNTEPAFSLIPLLTRDGTIRGYTKVDPSDESLVNTWTWSLLRTGKKLYAIRPSMVDGRKRTVYLHRFLLGLNYGDTREGDHLDGDGLNNRRRNLRIGTHAMNLQNQIPQVGRASKYRGVTWEKRRQKWQAQVKRDKRNIFLGYFSSEDAAAVAATSWREQNMPFFLAAS